MVGKLILYKYLTVAIVSQKYPELSLYKNWSPIKPTYEKTTSFLLRMDLQPYSHDCFSKISRTLFDFLNSTYWVSLFYRNNSLIFRTGVSCFSATLFYSTLLALTGRRNDWQRFTLTTHGLEKPFFQLCCCFNFFSGRKKILVLHTTYVLRVPYSCGVVLVFWLWRVIVFGITYVLSVQYSCAVVSVFLLWRES